MSAPDLELESLTDAQFAVAVAAFPYPRILSEKGAKIAARALAKKGWGEVESGGSGEVIFRLNQAASDVVEIERESWVEM